MNEPHHQRQVLIGIGLAIITTIIWSGNFIIAKGIIKPIAWFSNDKPLRSGWSWGQAYLKNGVTAFEATAGKGKLFAFGPEIIFRAQSQGTFKLLFNQLYLY